MMNEVSLFLAGDVMTGRRMDTHIGQQTAFDVIWGDAMEEWSSRPVHARIVNLETSITTQQEAWPDKRFHFRMHPDNIPVLSAAAFDVCVLANNHVLDCGYEGMDDTLFHLKQAGIKSAGAGSDLASASQPAEQKLVNGQRLLVFSWAHPSSFTPRTWAAGPASPGINLLDEYGFNALRDISRQIKAARRPGDIVLASIHWGRNWGYNVSVRQRWFARRLIDYCGVDIIHGHSSHHPLAIEIYRNRPIIYGCGDFINDYKASNKTYRPELVLMYFLDIKPDGALSHLNIVPMRIVTKRLHRATREEVVWLCRRINQGGDAVPVQKNGRLRWLHRAHFNTHWEPGENGTIAVRALKYYSTKRSRLRDRISSGSHPGG